MYSLSGLPIIIGEFSARATADDDGAPCSAPRSDLVIPFLMKFDLTRFNLSHLWQHLPAARTDDADAAHAAGAERLLPQVPGLRARPSFWDWCARKCSISLCVFFRSLRQLWQWFKWYDEPSNGRPKYGSCGENSNCECAIGCV